MAKQEDIFTKIEKLEKEKEELQKHSFLNRKRLKELEKEIDEYYKLVSESATFDETLGYIIAEELTKEENKDFLIITNLSNNDKVYSTIVTTKENSDKLNEIYKNNFEEISLDEILNRIEDGQYVVIPYEIRESSWYRVNVYDGGKKAFNDKIFTPNVLQKYPYLIAILKSMINNAVVGKNGDLIGKYTKAYDKRAKKFKKAETKIDRKIDKEIDKLLKLSFDGEVKETFDSKVANEMLNVIDGVSYGDSDDEKSNQK